MLKQYVSHLQSLYGDSTKVDVLPGNKYYKVITVGQWQRSVHAFVHKETLDLYKPASWKAPAKGARYNLLRDWNTLQQCMDRYGSYLYLR